MNKSISVIGTGYWGKNLVRNFHELGVLHSICDTNPEQLSAMASQYKISQTYQHPDEVFRSPEIKAVAIATPAASHYEIVKAALRAGKDVFVEKPLALQVEEAEELVQFTASRERILMVDHLLQYHPGVIKLKKMIDEGMLGKILYVYSNRLNIGQLRSAENILWSFAPHDISVILALLEKTPLSVRVFGEAYVQDDVFDTTVTNLNFGNRLKAHIFVSWLHPYKEQKLVAIGSNGMAVFNDTSPDEKLTFYPHKIDWIKQMPVANKANKEIIPIEQKEPLKEACLHFLDCIEKRQSPRTDAREALNVLRVLQKAQNSIDQELINEKV